MYIIVLYCSPSLHRNSWKKDKLLRESKSHSINNSKKFLMQALGEVCWKRQVGKQVEGQTPEHVGKKNGQETRK